MAIVQKGSEEFAQRVNNQIDEVKSEVRQELGTVNIKVESLIGTANSNQGTLSAMERFLQSKGFATGPAEPQAPQPQQVQAPVQANQGQVVAPKAEAEKEQEEINDKIAAAATIAVSSGGEEHQPPPAKAAKLVDTNEDPNL